MEKGLELTIDDMMFLYAKINIANIKKLDFDNDIDFMCIHVAYHLCKHYPKSVYDYLYNDSYSILYNVSNDFHDSSDLQYYYENKFGVYVP